MLLRILPVSIELKLRNTQKCKTFLYFRSKFTTKYLLYKTPSSLNNIPRGKTHHNYYT